MSGERLGSSGEQNERLSTPQQKILIKVDFDRTLAGPKYSEGILYHLAGPLKFPYSPLPGAAEGLQLLKDQPDVIFGGILTARNRFVKMHTIWQADQVSPGEQITYTTQSFTAKITNILEVAQEQERDSEANTAIVRTVLVDDNVRRVRNAATKLSENSHYQELMNKYGFTLVAFNPPDGTNLGNLPDGVMDVIPMSGWTPESTGILLQQLREKRK